MGRQPLLRWEGCVGPVLSSWRLAGRIRAQMRLRRSINSTGEGVKRGAEKNPKRRALRFPPQVFARLGNSEAHRLCHLSGRYPDRLAWERPLFWVLYGSVGGTGSGVGTGSLGILGCGVGALWGRGTAFGQVVGTAFGQVSRGRRTSRPRVSAERKFMRRRRQRTASSVRIRSWRNRLEKKWSPLLQVLLGWCAGRRHHTTSEGMSSSKSLVEIFVKAGKKRGVSTCMLLT